MNDEQLRQIMEKLDRIESEANSKGHLLIIVLLILIAVKVGACNL